MTAEITQDYLKSILRYDHEIGRFFWIAARRGRPVGRPAGYLRKDGYRYIKIDGIAYSEHRVAWLYVHGEMPKDQIDHINHCKDDNRIENLRDVSNRENARNSSKRKDNNSGVMGISWHKPSRKWRARICIDGKKKYLGLFEDYFDACCVRKSADLQYGFHENHGR